MESQVVTLTLSELYSYLVVFARFAGFLAFAPLFSEKRVNPRIRVLLGLLITLVVTPAVGQTLPAFEDAPFLFILTLTIQFLLGAFAALVAQVLFSALDVAGSLIGFQMGLANAFVSSAATAQQTGLPSLLLTMTATLLLFATDFHHVLILLVVESFQLMPPKDMSWLQGDLGDYSRVFLKFVAASFVLALQVAAPIIILGLLIFLAAGIMNRLLPNIQVFFILQPLQILLGLVLLAAGLGLLVGHFTEDFADKYQSIWNTR